MKTSLRVKIMISFSTLLFVLAFSLAYVSDKIFIEQFSSYMMSVKKQITNSILHDTEMVYFENEDPQRDDFLDVARRAFEAGIVYSYKSSNGVSYVCNGGECGDVIGLDDISKSDENVYYTEEFEITFDGSVVGTVKLGYYETFLFSDFEVGIVDMVRKSYIYVAFIFFTITLLASFIFAKSISKPLQKVSEKARQLKRGNYGTYIENTSSTLEIIDVVEALNSLSSALEKQSQIKKQMASNYAHEIRTPLSSISSTLEGVFDGVIEFDTKRKEILLAEVERLSTMVNKLDNISQYESKSLILNRTKFKVADLINEIYALVEGDFKFKNISFNIENNLCKQSELLFADREKIKQVLLNLISNSLKYTNDNGSVIIKLKYIAHRHHITVVDNGIGIEEKEYEHIFEHLYRVDKSRVRTTTGYGIGLSIVKDIVEAHSGQITVNSIVGEKTEFCIIL